MLSQRAAAAEAQILREAAYAAELQAMQQRSAQLTAQAASQVQQELQQKLGAKQVVMYLQVVPRVERLG